MNDLPKELRRIIDIELSSHAEKMMRKAADEIERLQMALKKRPVAFRVLDDNVWQFFTDEKEARDFADKIGAEEILFQGLYARDGS